jgi:hypothetical protein
MTDLQDSEPFAWKDDQRRPDPSAAELRHQLAGKRWARACDALEAWSAPRNVSDPVYAAVIREYQDAKAEHHAAARALPVEENPS